MGQLSLTFLIQIGITYFVWRCFSRKKGTPRKQGVPILVSYGFVIFAAGWK
jgi:hypothetical protein